MTPARWRAPREDGAVLVVPPWDELPGLVERNQGIVARSLRIGGLSVLELRRQCADELTGFARQYAQEMGLQVPVAPISHRPLIVTGHQPELYHPGVLVKNFAVSALASQLGGVSVNLTVDSDVAKHTGLTLPVAAEDRDEETLHFSDARPPLPYEEWRSNDETAFARLPDQARPIVHTWPWRPVLDDFWYRAQRAADKTSLIPERWLIARHEMETTWGVVNHELPMSRWCGSGSFGLLLGTFIERRAELAALYNEELARYRREQRIRSRNHPVADLKVSGDRIELPFWAWFPGTTQRGRLFARITRVGVELLVSSPDREVAIPGEWPQEVKAFGQHWPSLRATSWKIRPKALVTSMMLRLFVSDLFVHGIGGALYDELTDRIFRRFFATELPAFAVVTATLRLPWGGTPVEEGEERRLRQTLRSLYWNPDRFLDGPAVTTAAPYLRRKQELIHQPSDDGTVLRERHQQFEDIRDHLRPYVAERRQAAETSLHDVVRHHRHDEHRFSREHAWVLYPEAALRGLKDWCGIRASVPASRTAGGESVS